MAHGFVFHPLCGGHDPGSAHPERPARLEAVRQGLERAGLLAELDVLEPRAAEIAELCRVHPEPHVRAVERRCAAGPASLDGDTRVSEGSWQAALRAAGGALEALERVLDGRWRRAFVATRPPGHHAERERSMGFCLFNNAAVAAAALREAHGLERVCVLDWDVHHGNGTQHLFEDDPSVFYASLHQWPLYPGTGAATERGRGDGEGATLNCPLPAGSRDARWLGALEERVLPALDAFRPEFVLVSAGFDAHARDPLAGVELTAEGFRRMTRAVCDLADRHAGGRLVSLLEGGYDLTALAECAQAHVAELLA